MKIYTKKGDKGKDLMDMMSHLARPADATKINTNSMPVDGPAFCLKLC